MMHGLVHFRYNLQWRLSCLNPFSMTFTMLLFSHIHILLELNSYLVSCFQQYLTRAQHNNIPAPVNIRKNDGQIIGFYNWWSVPWQAGSVPEDNKRYWICPLLNYTFQVSLSMFEAQPAASSIVMKPITSRFSQYIIVKFSMREGQPRDFYFDLWANPDWLEILQTMVLVLVIQYQTQVPQATYLFLVWCSLFHIRNPRAGTGRPDPQSFHHQLVLVLFRVHVYSTVKYGYSTI